MFEFTLRSGFSARAASSISLNAHLRLETLEDRVVANAAPVVDSFYVMQHLPNRQVVVAGHVTDDMPGSTVTFSGVANGMVTVNAQGNFQVTLTASALGQITATARDFMGKTSTPVTLTLQNIAPVIQNFQAVQGSGNLWTFSGRIVDEAPTGLLVTLASGMPSLPSATVQVAADGTFSYVVELNNPLDVGTVTANCTDWWSSAAAQVSVVV